MRCKILRFFFARGESIPELYSFCRAQSENTPVKPSAAIAHFIRASIHYTLRGRGEDAKVPLPFQYVTSVLRQRYCH